MVNKHYVGGRKKEYEAIEDLVADGYHAQRSAGSHGIDVIAILTEKSCDDDSKPIFRAIMVTGNSSAGKIKDDMRKLMDMDLPSYVSQEVWVRIKPKDGVRWKKHTLKNLGV